MLCNLNLKKVKQIFKINNQLWRWQHTRMMGILNITPDSFSDGGAFISEKKALQQTEKLLTDGADLIDIGAQSTRPNAKKISATQEITRLKPLLRALKKEFPEAILSIDTFYADVVEMSYNEGIHLVNDISGGDYDSRLWDAVAKAKLPYILMHSNTSYEKMHQIEPRDKYSLLAEINLYFHNKIRELNDRGIHDIILDPGFGFGKSLEEQQYLLQHIQSVGFGNYPILVGISRKSFIYKPLGKTALTIQEETNELQHYLIKKNIAVLRVHEIPK